MRRSRAWHLALCGICSFTPAVARADDAATLRRAGHEWFEGERDSGYLWGGAGLLSLGTAGALYNTGAKTSAERGMSYPLAGFGVLQLAVGAGSLGRGRARDDDFDARVTASPATAKQHEVARMKLMGAAFAAVEALEATVVVGAVGYAATRTREDQARSRGVALGLAGEGGVMLLLDALAASRASRYAGQLDALSFSVAPTTGGAWMMVGGRF